MHGGNEEARYVGNFMAGRREGFGKIIWQDGVTYTGKWRYDQRSEGEMLFATGMKFQGQFYKDRIHGMGRLFIPIGQLIFEGEFKHGICPSVGKILYPDGDVFFGQHRQF